MHIIVFQNEIVHGILHNLIPTWKWDHDNLLFYDKYFCDKRLI